MNLDNSSSVEVVTGAGTPVATSVGQDLPIFSQNGVLMEPRINLLQGNGGGTFQNLITRGAFCTGSSERYTEIVEKQVDRGGAPSVFDITVGVYKTRQSNVLAQSVSLNYSYNVKNDPSDVECTMDISKFNTQISSKKTSGFLFWRKSKTSEQRAQDAQSGIDCKVNAEDGAVGGHERMLAIKDAMISEIGAEYILQYAESYEVFTSKEAPVAVLPNPGPAADKMGTALGALCGANVYCQVGTIVLKTGNELFGSASGGASSTDTVSGKITRKYNEHTYTTLKADATVDLEVSL
ncbi:MAG: hypothetical protein EOP04_13200 [Proteobacteria bacterium]|nr:MAG: hypothetical protein EOP04_13200 [Pseudomonadota bacterium]